MQSGPHSGSLQEGTWNHWPCRKPTQRQPWPAGDQAWFDSRIFAGDKSGMAGDRAGDSQRAPSASALDLGASPFWHRHQPPLSCDLRLNHAAFLMQNKPIFRVAPGRDSGCWEYLVGMASRTSSMVADTQELAGAAGALYFGSCRLADGRRLDDS